MNLFEIVPIVLVLGGFALIIIITIYPALKKAVKIERKKKKRLPHLKDCG